MRGSGLLGTEASSGEQSPAPVYGLGTKSPEAEEDVKLLYKF